MKIPRDISGRQLIKALNSVGYEITRQIGSHIRLSNSSHNITIPNHSFLRIGTLSSIIQEVSINLGLSKNELLLRIKKYL